MLRVLNPITRFFLAAVPRPIKFAFSRFRSFSTPPGIFCGLFAVISFQIKTHSFNVFIHLQI